MWDDVSPAAEVDASDEDCAGLGLSLRTGSGGTTATNPPPTPPAPRPTIPPPTSGRFFALVL